MGESVRHPAARLAGSILLGWIALGLSLALLVGLTQSPLVTGFKRSWPTARQDAALLLGLYAGLCLPLALIVRRLRARARGEPPAPPRSAARELGVGVGVGLGVLVWIVGCCELAAAAVTSPVAFGVVPSPVINHTWEPNSNHPHHLPQLGDPRFNEPFFIKTNAMGWREDREVPREKPPNTFRIFYVGDSFTAGACDADQSVPRVVERALNAASRDPGLRIEVVNTGTTSYSPLIYSTLVRHVLLEFEPDLIVINVDMTDVFDDWKYRKLAVYDTAGDPVAVPPRDVVGDDFVDTAEGAVRMTPWLRTKLLLYHHSRLYGYLIRRFGVKRAAKDSKRTKQETFSRWNWLNEPWGPGVEENVRKSLAVLERLAAWCHERGIRLALTGVPHWRQYGGGEGGRPKWSARPHRELAEVAQRAGVPYLNSYEALRPAIGGTEQDRYYYRHDMHFNPAGNALWAEAHVRFLSDPAHGLLPKAWYR